MKKTKSAQKKRSTANRRSPSKLKEPTVVENVEKEALMENVVEDPSLVGLSAEEAPVVVNTEPEKKEEFSLDEKKEEKKEEDPDLTGSRKHKGHMVRAFIVILLLLLTAIGFYWYTKEYKGANNSVSNSVSESEDLVSQVGQLYELPTGETPTIATVSDITKLSGQSFFARAQNGDKVLIYPTAKKAVLYRPSTNKIIEVGPVNIDTSASSQNTLGAATKASTSAESLKDLVSNEEATVSSKIALYNGTARVGLTRVVEKEIASSSSSFEVVAKENASSDAYEKTVVVDLTGKNKANVNEIIKILGVGESSLLPKSEEKPEADILVILGSDY